MRSGLVLVGGAILVLSFLAHATLGWRVVGGALRDGGTPAELMPDVAAVWFLSSTAMAAFGLVAFVYGWRLRRGDASGVAALRILGTAYALYGAAAFVLTGLNPHFLLMFVLPGCLLAVPTLF